LRSLNQDEEVLGKECSEVRYLRSPATYFYFSGLGEGNRTVTKVNFLLSTSFWVELQFLVINFII